MLAVLRKAHAPLSFAQVALASKDLKPQSHWNFARWLQAVQRGLKARPSWFATIGEDMLGIGHEPGVEPPPRAEAKPPPAQVKPPHAQEKPAPPLEKPPPARAKSPPAATSAPAQSPRAHAPSDRGVPAQAPALARAPAPAPAPAPPPLAGGAGVVRGGPGVVRGGPGCNSSTSH